MQNRINNWIWEFRGFAIAHKIKLSTFNVFLILTNPNLTHFFIVEN